MDTIQKKILNEIKKRDKIKFTDLADELGISKAALTHRLNGNITLENLWEILKVCGYDINIAKTPTYREPTVSIGEVNCDNCLYKLWYNEVEDITKRYKEELQKNNFMDFQQDGAGE